MRRERARGGVRMALAPALALALALAGCTLKPPVTDRPYYEEVLHAEPFTTLVVEIDHAPGRAPSEAAKTHLVETLRNVTSKQTVRILLEESLPQEPKRWTATSLVELEKSTRTTAHVEPVAVLHVLYPAGEFEREGVAGVTVSGPVIGPVAIFLDTLRELRTDVGPLPLPGQAVEPVERATLLHEAGHAMGLVNNGLPMVDDHEDKDHDGHSTNARSVMYWQVESLAGIRDALLRDGTVPSEFDADDRADMKAAGGR